MSFGWGQEVEWSQIFGGTSDDEGWSIKQTLDGGYIAAGFTGSFGNGNYDLWLIKTDSNGNEEWNQTYGGSNNDLGISIEQVSDGGYVVVGYTNSYGNGGFDFWLIKLDSNGNKEWDNTYGGDGDEFVNSFKETLDGGYIIIGKSYSYAGLLLVKTDSNGNEQWNQIYDLSITSYGESIQLTSDGGYIFVGSSPNPSGVGGHDLRLVKIDINGNEEWNQTYGWDGSEFGESIQQTSDGGYIITGFSNSYDPACDLWLIKTDSNGNQEWNQMYGGINSEFGKSVKQTSDGGYIITGYTNSFGNGSDDLWLIKTDPSGNEEWNQTYGGYDRDRGYSIEQTFDAGYIICGYTGETNNFEDQGSNLWLIKIQAPPPLGDVNQDGQIDIVDVVTVIQIVLNIYEPNETEEYISDYNSDGSIDVSDVILIIGYILEN